MKKDKKARMRESAERYEWMRKNSASFSWVPSRYSEGKVTGFAAYGTGYLGFDFDEAVKMAMARNKLTREA